VEDMVTCRQRRFGNNLTTTDYFDAAASALLQELEMNKKTDIYRDETLS
jgi:hypothetical protein